MNCYKSQLIQKYRISFQIQKILTEKTKVSYTQENASLTVLDRGDWTGELRYSAEELQVFTEKKLLAFPQSPSSEQDLQQCSIQFCKMTGSRVRIVSKNWEKLCCTFSNPPVNHNALCASLMTFKPINQFHFRFVKIVQRISTSSTFPTNPKPTTSLELISQ